jgi:hypothetical protein
LKQNYFLEEWNEVHGFMQNSAWLFLYQAAVKRLLSRPRPIPQE